MSAEQNVNGVELAERREPSGDDPIGNRKYLPTYRSACVTGVLAHFR